MNIFILDNNPKICAQYHCNRHCIKMILELAQMLSTCHRELDEEVPEILYKATHKNHPCNVWLRQASGNYEWTYQLFVELNLEYTYRYGKTHLSYTKLNDLLKVLPANLPRGEMTPPALAMPDDCRFEGNPVFSYRMYYNLYKKNLLQYTRREKPYWILPVVEY